MKILSICSTEYNSEQAKGIIYWLNGNKDSHVLKLPNIHNLMYSYFILLIYFVFLRWFTFVKIEENYTCVIVTGKSVVAQAIIIADQLSVPIRTVQKPFGYPWFLFEYQYIPYHDLSKFPASNQIPTLLAPNTMEYRINYNKEKKISILLGGSIHNKSYNTDNIHKEISQYQNNKKYKDYKLEVIVSRRTPETLKREIKNKNIEINDIYGATKDAYYNSEILVITDDSFCMISEAIQSGRIPFIIDTKNNSEKLKKGIRLLAEKKLVMYNNEFK